jgi:hypothetical protein
MFRDIKLAGKYDKSCEDIRQFSMDKCDIQQGIRNTLSILNLFGKITYTGSVVDDANLPISRQVLATG